MRERLELDATTYATESVVGATSRIAVHRGEHTASITVGPASSHRFAADTLRRTSVVSSPDGPPELARLALYLALRRARIASAKTVLLHGGEQPQRLDLAIAHAHATLDHELAPAVFSAEIVETFEHWLHDLYGRGFFRAVWDGTLGREQYVYTISNMHQFVRWTTRLLGLAVANSHDRNVRNHFLHHLQGEINHELIIERDLAHLGADVDFVISRMAASEGTRHFMAVQESMIAHARDPVLFLASPLAAEGIASHLTPDFIAAMERAIAGWGVTDPANAMMFFRSHVNTDGGDDGHWLRVTHTLEQHLHTEAALATFLGILRASTSALTAAYDEFVDDVAVFRAGSSPA
jgi:hypothetical protein